MHSRIDPRILAELTHHEDGNGRMAGRRRGDAPSVDALLHAAIDVATGGAEGASLVLAISGGRDSMALLYAMHRWARSRIAAVATFDHGTGGPASEAAALVASEARHLGLTVVRERARGLAATEQAWREARWEFLRRVARAFNARVATAHTRDDQVETIVMRLLRGSGARGLAALAAPSEIVRPWLPVARDEVAHWVDEHHLPFVEDPANDDMRYLRVRVRRELLPAFERVDPGFAEQMLTIADRASTWRRDLDAHLEQSGHVTRSAAGALHVNATLFTDLDDAERAMYWQGLFGMVGVALDGRGTRELVRFSRVHRRGTQLMLAGGARVVVTRDGGDDRFVLRRAERRSVFSFPDTWSGESGSLPRRVGRWRFVREAGDANDSPWHMPLPAKTHVKVRPWEAGDRLLKDEKQATRRVTRYFAEAGVPAPDRQGWPVVLVDGHVVWVPGVCRSGAAPYRPGRPDLIWYRCEREHS